MRPGLLVSLVILVACSGEDGDASPPTDVLTIGDQAIDAGTASDAALVVDQSVEPDAAPDAAPAFRALSPGDGETHVVTYTGECGDFGIVFALEDEVGHWAAVRLTPPAWPFEVSTIAYALAQFGRNDDPQCAALSHRAYLIAGGADGPPPDVMGETVMQPAILGVGQGRGYHELRPSPALRLEEGESVYLVVEMAAIWPDALCLVTCRDPMDDPTQGFWSGAVAPPFDWVDLAEFDLGDPIVAEMVGTVR